MSMYAPGEDEHVEIDSPLPPHASSPYPPSTNINSTTTANTAPNPYSDAYAYAHTDPATRARLRALARRGLTALSSLPPSPSVSTSSPFTPTTHTPYAPLDGHTHTPLSPFDTPHMGRGELSTTPVIMSPEALAAPPPTFLRALSAAESAPLPLPAPKHVRAPAVPSADYPLRPLLLFSSPPPPPRPRRLDASCASSLGC